MADYLDALNRINNDDTAKIKAKHAMMDKIHALYNKNKVP
jgi:hypothetical protein